MKGIVMEKKLTQPRRELQKINNRFKAIHDKDRDRHYKAIAKRLTREAPLRRQRGEVIERILFEEKMLAKGRWRAELDRRHNIIQLSCRLHEIPELAEPSFYYNPMPNPALEEPLRSMVGLTRNPGFKLKGGCELFVFEVIRTIGIRPTKKGAYVGWRILSRYGIRLSCTSGPKCDFIDPKERLWAFMRTDQANRDEDKRE